jgi:branched-chain amino acid transport system ATP-binding protein
MSEVLLSISGLNTHYGRAHILRDAAFDVQRGEVMALLGRNGAGKSTTLKAIMGLVPVSRGEILFQAAPAQGLPTYRISRLGIGYVPEDRRIFADLTVMENLEVGMRPARPGAPRWNADTLFGIFPNLARMRDRPGGRLSGGEQQMLSIARTLMGNPSLLLLDEPSEGLAPLILEHMARAIQAMKAQGLTVLLSEQNLHFASQLADRAVVLEKGQIRYAGRMAELAADETVQREYLSA